MNLYAVQALLARVYWMKQDMDSAAIYAKKVIDSQKFPLMTSSDFVQFERGGVEYERDDFRTLCTYLCFKLLFDIRENR